MLHRFFCRLRVHLVDCTSWGGVFVLFEAVAVNHWYFAPLGHLAMVLIIVTYLEGCDLVGRGQGCCQTLSCTASIDYDENPSGLNVSSQKAEKLV